MSDWLNDLAQQVIAHPDDVAKIGRTVAGMTVVESSLVEAGNYYIVDPSVLRTDTYWLPNRVTVKRDLLGVADPYSMDFDAISWKLRYEFGLGSRIMQPSHSWESPEWGRAKDLRARYGESITWTTGARR